jgi:hypothetical protein
MSKEVVALVAVGVFFWVVVKNPPTVNGPAGTTEIPTETTLSGIRGANDADSVITLTSRDEKRTSLGRLFVRDDRVFEPDGSLEPRNLVDAKRERYAYLLQFGIDAGGWGAGYLGSLSDDGDTRRVQYGVRFSPARIFYGAVAPDIVAGEESAGIGISVYPITDRCGRFWKHAGLGAWYLFPYDRRDNPAWSFGLSFSTYP